MIDPLMGVGLENNLGEMKNHAFEVIGKSNWRDSQIEEYLIQILLVTSCTNHSWTLERFCQALNFTHVEHCGNSKSPCHILPAPEH